MEFVLVVAALALASCGAGLILGLKSRREARRLTRLNDTLEARVVERTHELRLALAAADEQARGLAVACQAKSDFLASVSHELRTPLNAVIGFAELLRMNERTEPLTLRQSQAVEQILFAGQHLLGLIEDVLDLARIEAGRLSMAVERVDPQLVVRQVCDQLKPQAQAARVTVKAPPRRRAWASSPTDRGCARCC